MLTETTSSASFLREEYVRRRASNPRFSMRSFAKLLSLSPGALSEIFRGKRPMSLRTVARVSNRLGLTPLESQHLSLIVQKEASPHFTPSPPNDLRERPLSLDLFQLVSDWYCFAILNLAETKGFRFDSRWIGRRLGISQIEVKVALDRLQRVGLIEKHQGKLRLSSDFVLSPEGIPSEAVRRFHEQILGKAVSALATQSLEEREISGITFALSPRNIPWVKRDMNEFLNRLAKKYSKGQGKEEVYHLELALFRLTELERR